MKAIKNKAPEVSWPVILTPHHHTLTPSHPHTLTPSQLSQCEEKSDEERVQAIVEKLPLSVEQAHKSVTMATE